jgi:predicted small secreted protein
MRKILLTTAAVAAAICLAGCGNGGSGTSKDTHVAKHDVVSLLHKKYQNSTIKYYNDLNYLGIGVANPKRFDFKFITDTATGKSLNIENIEEQEYLIPIFYKPDYQIFYMPVIDSSNNYYEVKVNTEISVFVNKHDFIFYTWEEIFTKQANSVKTEKGYVKQDIGSESVMIDDNKASLIVKAYDGEWLLVDEELDDGIKRNTYWVKWRANNKLLATPTFLY